MILQELQANIPISWNTVAVAFCLHDRLDRIIVNAAERQVERNTLNKASALDNHKGRN